MANLAELNARIEAMSRAAAEKQGKLKEFEEYNRSVGLTPQTSPSSFGVSTSGSSSGKGTTKTTQTSTGNAGADAISQAMSQRAETLAARVQELNRLQEDLNRRYAALQSGQSTETAEQLALEQDRLNDRKVNYERDSAQYGMDAAYYDQILAAAPYIAVERQAEETGTSVSGGVQAMIDTMQQRVNQIDQRRKSVQEEQAAIEERVRLLQHNTALSEEERAAEQTAINQAVARLTGRQQNLMRDAGIYSEDARAYDDALIERAEQDMMDFAKRQMDAYYDEAAMQEAYEGQRAALYAEWQELQSREQISGLYGDRTASDVWSEIQGLEDRYQKQKVEADEYWTGKQLQGLSERDRENLETIVRSEFGETAFSRLQPGKGKNQEVSKAYQDLYEKYSYREVESYLQIVRRQENAKTGTIMQETVQKLTKEKPVAANVAIALSKIPATIGAAAEFAGQIVNNPAGYRTLDVFGAGNVLQNAGRTVQQTTVDEIKAKLSPFWGNVASGAYRLGMSTVDSLMAMGSGTGLLLAANAATNTIQDITERGGTIGQALAGGILAGAAEAVFEKVSIENFQALSQTEVVRTVRDWVGNVAKSMATNASEEMATEFANIVTDSFVMGEFSNYAEAVRDLMEQNPGMSEGEAKMRVAGQMGLQILESGASGAIMGGFFGLLGSGIGQRRTTLRDGMVSGAIAQGLGYEGSEAFQLAAGLQVQLNEGFDVSDEDLSRLIAANQMQAEQREAAGANVEQTAAAAKTEDVLALPEAMGQIEEAMPEVQTETVMETSGEDENVRTTEEVQEETSQEEVRQEVAAPTVQEAVQEESAEGNIPARAEAESTAEGITEENTLRQDAVEDLRRLSEEYQGVELQQAAQNLANDMRMAGETAYAEEIEAVAAEMVTEPAALSANDVTAPESAVQERGVEYGGAERSADGSGERDAGAYTGGSSGILGERADGRKKRSAQNKRAAQRQTRVHDLRPERVSAKSLGLAQGSDLENVTVVPEAAWDGELQATAERVWQEAGLEVQYILGKIRLETEVGTRYAKGAIVDGKIIIQADNLRYTVDQIADHELFHDIARGNRGLVSAIREEIRERYTREEYEKIVERYLEAYAGVYENDEELLRKIAEEIFADAYAGINQFSERVETYRGVVREITDRRTGRMGDRGTPETRAGPEGTKNAQADDEAERYSIAGERAETADREALAAARQMQADGVEAAEIFRETGWYQGREGKWRFEIDDSVMTLNDMNVVPNIISLGELVDAPMLFEAYRDLSDMLITFERMEKGLNGAYNRQFDDIALSYTLKSDKEALLSSLLHEVQHAIQAREQFARGATVEYWKRKIREGFDSRTAEQRRESDRVREELDRIRENDPEFYTDMIALEEMTPSVPRAEIDWDTLEQIGEDPIEWQEFDARRETLEKKYGSQRVFDFMNLQYQMRRSASETGRSATDLYYDTAGEREARDVAARRKLGADERRSRMPDLGDENTVFAEGAEESFSLDAEPSPDSPAAEAEQIWEELRGTYGTGAILDGVVNGRIQELREQGETETANVLNRIWRTAEETVAPATEYDDRGERWTGEVRTNGDENQSQERLAYWATGGRPETVSEAEERLWTEVDEERLREAREQAKAEREERLRLVTRENFTATPAVEKLGVRIEGSVADYGKAEGLRRNDAAAKETRRQIARAERRLNPTAKEKEFASGLAAGVYDLEDIPSTMSPAHIVELADLYSEARSLGLDMIKERRREINGQLDEVMQELFHDSEQYKPMTAMQLYHNTPQRIMQKIFGDKLGDRINREIFDPVARNEAERLRFMNRQFDRVRTFRDSKGRMRGLSRAESALTQQIIEGRAVEEQVAALEMKGAIEDAAEQLRKGGVIGEIMEKFGLGIGDGKTVERYARWLDAQEAMKSGKVDAVKVENAADEYRKIFDEYYEAINDFLVVHGYEPIGFIKGYAPHMQSDESKDLLEKALKTLGIQTEVAALPTTIAGLTSEYKPGKRWNPYFLSRHTDQTDYDIESAFESYVNYMSDVLYHTDDIMRVRRMSRYFRKSYSPEEIKGNIDWAESLRYAPTEDKMAFLRDMKVLDYGTVLSAEEAEQRMEAFIEGEFQKITENTKFGDLVSWLDNYANILAGKQSVADRGFEAQYGRKLLNWGRRVSAMFSRANVAGNISSALNQSAQLPQIVAENGTINTLKAIGDIVSGKVRKAGFAEESDFLTGKRGVGFLVTKPGDMVTTALFKPAEFVDGMLSTMAVRGAYHKAVRQGMSHEEAMRKADRTGQSIMASRVKGVKPMAFESKNFLAQMVNMFQVEALNSWQHLAQDLPRDFRDIAETKGRRKAAMALSGVVVKMLLGAFLMNRMTDELYGGTPAPFDLVGMSANFIASGEGLVVNEMLRMLIDNVFEDLFGERPFETERRDPNERQEFDWDAAWKDLWYEVSNEIPYLSNLSGLLGWGDQTLPLPDVYGNVENLITAIKNAGWVSAETGEAVIKLIGEFFPGGRQMTKTAQGVKVMLEGGRYYGYGDNRRLQYPVDGDAENWIKAVLFGYSSLSETNSFYASGVNGLSAKQTKVYEELIGAGYDSGTLYETLQAYNAAEDSRGERAAITAADLTDRQKLNLYTKLKGDSREEEFAKLMNAGLSWAETMAVYDEYAELYNTEGMNPTEKATRYAMWVDEQGYDDKQTALIKDELKFFNMAPAEAGNYEKFSAAGLSIKESFDLATTFADLEPEKGKDQVSNMQKYRAIVASGMDENEQLKAIGAIMGTDMLTESGEPSQYAKMLEILDDGTTITEYLDLKDADRVDAYLKAKEKGIELETYVDLSEAKQVDNYLEAVELGLSKDSAYKAVMAVAALPELPEGESYDTGDRQAAAVAACKTVEEQIIAYAAYGNANSAKTNTAKFTAAAEYDVSPALYLEAREFVKANYNANGNSSLDQKEVAAGLRAMDLTNSQRAALFQLFGSSWKKNPFGNASSIRDAYEAAKE